MPRSCTTAAATASLVLAFFLTQTALEAREPGDAPAPPDWAAIRAEYERHRHAVVARPDGGYAARNPRQRWVAQFDGRGFQLVPDGPDDGWRWGLELQRWGWTGSTRPAAGAAAVVVAAHAQGGRLVFPERASGLEEWFINDERGLEHGFTVYRRPAAAARTAAAGSESLCFDLAIRGDLRPQTPVPAGAATTIRFTNAAGVAILTYAGLRAWDASGRSLPARMMLTPGGDGGGGEGGVVLRMTVDERGARYPLTVDPVVQRAYMKASNTGAGDRFGSGVAISGNLIAVGAPWESSGATGIGGNQADNSALRSGAVYLFSRSSTTGGWRQEAYIKASNTGSGDSFGDAVALSGNTLVVGAWGERSNATGVNGNQSNDSVMFSGAAYVFRKLPGGGWYQEAYLKPDVSRADQQFGLSVAISGETVIVGAMDRTGPGAAHVFARSGSTWFAQARLTASNAEARDAFGRSVAISGETAVVGAVGEASNATGVNGDQTNNGAPGAGAAYLFRRSGGTVWTQEAYLKASSTGGGAFGSAVAVAGNAVAVGAPGRGTVYTFWLDAAPGGTWRQSGDIRPSTGTTGDEFGTAVALAATNTAGGFALAAGAPAHRNGTGASTGAVFGYFGAAAGTKVSWKAAGVLHASNAAESDRLGRSVSLSVAKSGEIFGIAGAPLEGSGATGVGGDQNDNSALESGAAYPFEMTSTVAGFP